MDWKSLKKRRWPLKQQKIRRPQQDHKTRKDERHGMGDSEVHDVPARRAASTRSTEIRGKIRLRALLRELRLWSRASSAARGGARMQVGADNAGRARTSMQDERDHALLFSLPSIFFQSSYIAVA